MHVREPAPDAAGDGSGSLDGQQHQPRGAVLGIVHFDTCLPLAACACHPDCAPPLCAKYVWTCHGHRAALEPPMPGVAGKLGLWSCSPLLRAALARVACGVRVSQLDWERAKVEHAMCDKVAVLRRRVSMQRSKNKKAGGAQPSTMSTVALNVPGGTVTLCALQRLPPPATTTSS